MDAVLRQFKVAGWWVYLPTFRVVAELGSVTGAAKHLFVTPSAVSKTIKQLEGALAVSLFERNGSGVTLTEAGRVLLSAAREVLRRLDDAQAELSATPLTLRVIATDHGLFVLGRLLGRGPRTERLELRRIEETVDATALVVRGSADVALVEVAQASDGDGVSVLDLGGVRVAGQGPSLPFAAAAGLASLGAAGPTRTVGLVAVLRAPSDSGEVLRRAVLGLIADVRDELEVLEAPRGRLAS